MEVEKKGIFGPKPWVNPFGKIAMFRILELLDLIALQGVLFFVLEYRKKNFPGLYCLKKRS